MNENETVNERRARENAERIAAHQKMTARPTVVTRDEIVLPTFVDYDRKEAENADRVKAAQRADAIKFWTLKYGVAPSDAQLAQMLEGRQ